MVMRNTMRNTMNIPRQQHRRQVRSFALAWTGLTLLMGAAAFVAIYAATGVVVANGGGVQPASLAGAALPQTQPATAEISAVTPIPTLGAIASNTPLVAADSPVAAKIDPAVAANTALSAPVAVALQVTVTPLPIPVIQPTAAQIQPTSAPVQPVAKGTIPPVNDRKFDLGIQVQAPPDRSVQTHELWMKMVSEQLKLNWVKHQIRWRDLETTKGDIDFGILNLVLPIAAKSQTKVMLSIVTAPDWAREKGVQIVKDRQGPPVDPQTYVNFVTTIVKKYPGLIHGIEVWNEQNLDREWDSPKGLQAAQYVALLSATYTAVKAIDPNIVIISGALSPTGTSNPPKWYDDTVYIDMLIKAGMLNYADCVGAHHNGYNIGPNVTFQQAPQDPKRRRAIFRGPFDNPNHLWSFNSTLSTYAAKVKAAGSGLKLCVTEFGWASMEDIKTKDGKRAAPPRGFEFAADNTLAEQADYFDQAITTMIAWDYIQLAFVWNLNYGAQIGWDPTNDNVPYSILGPGFQQRPAWQKITDRNFRGQPRQ